MKIEYDKQADAMYIKFVDGSYSESNEIEQGIVLDYDKNNKIIGIEILEASRKLPFRLSSSLSQAVPLGV